MKEHIKNLEFVFDFIEEMKTTTSNNVKKEILKKHVNNEFLRKVFHYTFNPFFQFNVSRRNIINRPELIHTINNYDNIFSLLDDLNEMNITGYDAIKSINAFTNELSPKATEVFYHIIDRNLKMRSSTATINAIFKNCIPTFSVALANGYHPNLVDFENEQWFGSRKLDGIRCLAIKKGNDVTFLSRSGKPFYTLDRVKQDILNLDCKEDFILDGEICLINDDGSDDFQGIIKQIRRKNHTIKNPKFYIFDCLTHEEFNSKNGRIYLNERLQRCPINIIHDTDHNYKSLYVLPQIHITSETIFSEMVLDAEKNGYEGIMVRKNETYEGKRSKNLLKVKKFHDEEYIVKNVDLGKMRFVENGKEITKDVLRNIIVEHKGNNVSIGSGFSKQQREYYFENPNELIGKTVTIQYFEETQNQSGGLSLRFPVIKHIYKNGRDC